jgi:hypothetical protein
MVWRDQADGYDMLGRYDRSVRRHSNDRIKITCRQSVGKIADIIRKECFDQTELRTESGFDQVGLAVDLNFLLALFDDRADAGNGMDPPCSCLTQPKACMGLRESGASHATRNFRH